MCVKNELASMYVVLGTYFGEVIGNPFVLSYTICRLANVLMSNHLTL